MSHIMMKSDDFTYCARLARKQDYGRYLGALAAPAARRDALLVLLAFNDELGRIREIVSEPALGYIRLAWWRDCLMSGNADVEGAHPVARALIELMSQGTVSRDSLLAMIEGRAEGSGPEPFGKVEEVAGQAANTSGKLAHAELEVLGVSDVESIKCASEVAIAWGLIGLLRAVPWHERAGRPFLGETIAPADLLDCVEDNLIAARGRARMISRQALPVLYPARLCDQWLARFRAAGNDPWKVNPDLAPVTLVWQILSGRVLGRF